jgi:hypothetical protein
MTLPMESDRTRDRPRGDSRRIGHMGRHCWSAPTTRTWSQSGSGRLTIATVGCPSRIRSRGERRARRRHDRIRSEHGDKDRVKLRIALEDEDAELRHPLGLDFLRRLCAAGVLRRAPALAGWPQGRGTAHHRSSSALADRSCIPVKFGFPSRSRWPLRPDLRLDTVEARRSRRQRA